PAEARALAPLGTGDGSLGATFCPSDGIASPHAVTSAYAGAGRRLGVKFMEWVAATAIVRDGARIAGVKTTDGDFATQHVFNCAGAWAREIGSMDGVDVPVDPSPRDIFVTDPMGSRRHRTMTIGFRPSFSSHPAGG